jgi:aspartate/methionine/tyrosine aminotransferase
MECNGRGVHYPDDPNGVCECYECFNGTQCEFVIPESECTIQDVAGNPLLYQEFWQSHDSVNSKYSVTIDTSYRTSYSTGALTPNLIETIQQLHTRVKNVNVQGKYIVLGTGATNLIAASIWAMRTLYIQQQSKPIDAKINVFAHPPYYGGYKSWSDMYPSQTIFNSSLQLPDAKSIIEFVTVPNNPTGHFRHPYYTQSPYIVHDMVYYWPSLTDTTVCADFDVMLFSLSKLSGHAGSRFGWAVVKDKQVADLMTSFISSSQVHPSVDTQYRAYRILQYLAQDSTDSFFTYIKDKMTEKWNKIIHLFETKTKVFHIESVPGQFYLFVHCSSKSVLSGSKTCYDLFKQVGILTWAGEGFGVTSEYVRLELVVRDTTFDTMLLKLERLFNTVTI